MTPQTLIVNHRSKLMRLDWISSYITWFAMPSAPEADTDDDAPVIIDAPETEPVYSSEGAPAGSERRERSLRELFWGED